jgi:hypothetical protein
VFRPEDFPRFEYAETISVRRETIGAERSVRGIDKSQSAKDYGFARRAFERGQSSAEVAAAIAAYRTDKGHDAARYARVTVENALRKDRGISVGM